MTDNKINWEQFKNCNNDSQSIHDRFEDLCRQLFILDELSENKVHTHIHCNHNNPGIEGDPIYDEKNNIWLGFQVKFFDSSISYDDILKSAKKTVKYYKGKVDKVYLYCNKKINTHCNSYKNIESTLGNEGIALEVHDDTVILDDIRLHHPILGTYYFEEHRITDTWLKSNLDRTIAKLGTRFNSRFDISTETSNLLSLFARDKTAVAILNARKRTLYDNLSPEWRYSEYDKVLEGIRKVIEDTPDITEDNITDALSWNEKLKTNASSFITSISSLQYQLKIEISKLTSEPESKGKPSEIEYKISSLRSKLYYLNTIQAYIREFHLSDTEIMLLSDTRVLIVEGDAGIGKSHMIAKEVMQLIESGRTSLMFLGGDYLSDSSINEQICTETGFPLDFNTLLDLLDNRGELQQKPVVICIDALNETRNIKLWNIALPAIFNKIQETKWLRLVLSIRPEYEADILDIHAYKNQHFFMMLKHHGFAENTLDATRQFLSYYDIPFSPDIYFYSELHNPLFLTLYCETYTGDNFDLPELYDKLIYNANTNIHEKLQLADKGYTLENNLVGKFIDEFAELIHRENKKEFTLEEINKLAFWKTTGITSYNFILSLTQENILHDVRLKDTTVYRFSYDQMNDYYVADTIVRKARRKQNILKYMKHKILRKGIRQKTESSKSGLFINLCSCYANRFSEEATDIIKLIRNEATRKAFFRLYMNSLAWRDRVYLGRSDLLESCKEYSMRWEELWNLLITSSIKQNSPFNADCLHAILKDITLSKRDYIWTTYINSFERTNPRLMELIKLYVEGKGLKFRTQTQAELFLTLLTWLLTSSNTMLRDMTTKAITEILKDNYELCLPLLVKFKNINDPYVLQRLYAAIWGATAKRGSNQEKSFHNLCKYIYEKIFQAETPYPDILLRNYAELIIESFIHEHPDQTEFEETAIHPTYRLEPIPDIPDMKYLEHKEIDGIFHIIHSMKFDKIFSGFSGDFGKYVFQPALGHFNVDQKAIFNYSIYFILENLGYDNSRFSEYDRYIGQHGGAPGYGDHTERIGKKYQRIAMYNILARISDHHDKIQEYEDQSPVYEGPWDPFVRDIDPSLNLKANRIQELPVFNDAVIRETCLKDITSRQTSQEDRNNWLDETYHLAEECNSFLKLNDFNGTEWIMLYNCIDTRQIFNVNNEFQAWCFYESFLVTAEQYNKIKDSYEAHTEDSWLPPHNHIHTYTLFNREYPWSKACNDFCKNQHVSIELKEEIIPTTPSSIPLPEFPDENTMIAPVLTPKELNILEKVGKQSPAECTEEIISSTGDMILDSEINLSEYDFSSLIVPCKEIIDTMNLKYGSNDFVFYDNNDKVAALDTVLCKSISGFVIRKDILDAFLKKTDYKLIYFIDGAKELHTPINWHIERDSRWKGLMLYNGKSFQGHCNKDKIYQD